jgi:hypothetical protein
VRISRKAESRSEWWYGMGSLSSFASRPRPLLEEEEEDKEEEEEDDEEEEEEEDEEEV